MTIPKFTITTDNSEGERHNDPIDFPTTKAATDDAQIALAEMARDKLPDGKHVDFGVKVEDESGREIYRASLDFDAKIETILPAMKKTPRPPPRRSPCYSGWRPKNNLG